MVFLLFVLGFSFVLALFFIGAFFLCCLGSRDWKGNLMDRYFHVDMDGRMVSAFITVYFPTLLGIIILVDDFFSHFFKLYIILASISNLL